MDTNIKNNYFLSHSHLSNSKCRFLLIRKMLQKTYQNWVSSNVLNCNLACDLALLQLDTLSDPENPVLAFTWAYVQRKTRIVQPESLWVVHKWWAQETPVVMSWHSEKFFICLGGWVFGNSMGKMSATWILFKHVLSAFGRKWYLPLPLFFPFQVFSCLLHFFTILCFLKNGCNQSFFPL